MSRDEKIPFTESLPSGCCLREKESYTLLIFSNCVYMGTSAKSRSEKE
jgi:hypothetical protein